MDHTIKSSLLEKLPFVHYAFGTKKNPWPWEDERMNAPSLRQIHGKKIREVLEASQDCGEGDGLVTQLFNIPICIRTADCVPVLLASKNGRAIAALHAGWRGTVAGILEEFSDWVIAQKDHPSQWVSVIGPAIGPCCYAVGSDLIQSFQDTFPMQSRSQIEPIAGHLDLPSVVEGELQRLGFEVETIRKCTFCSVEPSFNSYRRDPSSDGRQYSFLVKRSKSD